jgi:hypothetical protein
MLFRLLIDFELVEYTKTLPAAQRRRLYAHFRKIQEYPGHYSDLIENDPDGHRLDISYFEDLAIGYWTDGADRHVKILRIAKRRLK